jgi:hypothetical protein
MKYSSSHNSGTWNFKVAPRFLENLCNATLNHIFYKMLEHKLAGRTKTNGITNIKHGD